MSAAAAGRAEVSQPASCSHFCRWSKIPESFTLSLGWLCRPLVHSACPVLFWAVQKDERVAEAGLCAVSCVISCPFALGELSEAPAHFHFLVQVPPAVPCKMPTVSPSLALPFPRHWSLGRTGGCPWHTWVPEELSAGSGADSHLSPFQMFQKCF